jgi:hypothetical protein
MFCWYCSVREAEAKHTYSFDMYGDVDAQKADMQTAVAYRVRHIEIPRCADCRSRHRLVSQLRFFTFVLAVLVILAAINTFFNWTGLLIGGLLLGFSAGLLASLLFAGPLVQKGIHSVAKGRSKYPEVQELLNQQYKFGARPKAAPEQKDHDKP